MALLRQYVDLGNGMVAATGYVQCNQTGNVTPAGIGPRTIRSMTLGQAQAQGFPVVSAPGSGSGANNAIDQTENQIGQTGLARREFQDGNAGGMVYTYNLSFANASGGTVTAYIGDGNRITFTSQSGTALPNTVTIGGTWGTSSFAIWRLVTNHTPVRVTKIRIGFDNASYQQNGTLFLYKTRPDAITSTQNLNLTTWLSPIQYQSLILENPTPLRIVWDASVCLAAGIPNGRTVTFTFYYSAVSDVHNMRKIGMVEG